MGMRTGARPGPEVLQGRFNWAELNTGWLQAGSCCLEAVSVQREGQFRAFCSQTGVLLCLSLNQLIPAEQRLTALSTECMLLHNGGACAQEVLYYTSNLTAEEFLSCSINSLLCPCPSSSIIGSPWSKIMPLVLFLTQCFTSAWQLHHLVVLAFHSQQTFSKHNTPTLQPCFHSSHYDLTAYASKHLPKSTKCLSSSCLSRHLSPEQWHP